MEREESWVDAAREGRLADAIEEIVRTHQSVTFVELSNRLEPYVEVGGTFAMELVPNVLLWAGMSEPFVDALNELRVAKRIWPWPASVLAYLFDGGMLNLPIAKRPPKNGYKREHWAPVTLHIDPPPLR